MHPSHVPPSAPTFSVLIATCNQASYLADALDSVAAQSCDDYEIVVVNDGSTDDTAERLADWVGRFRLTHPNRVMVSTVENAGQSAAWEHGVELCRGRFVCLLDSDDRWLPEKLAEVKRVVESEPHVGMIVHPLYVIGPEGARTGDVRPQKARLSEGDLREELRRTGRHVAPATSGISISREVFRNLMPPATRGFAFGADAYLSFGASMLAPVRAIPTPLGEYRMHPSGQYIRRMLTPEGLSKSVELQLAIARRFGVEEAARNASGFARNVFAVAKYSGGPLRQTRAFVRLIRATWADGSFGAKDRIMLALFWTACFIAPRPLFVRLWRTFQLKQTGFDKLGRAHRPSRAVAGALRPAR